MRRIQRVPPGASDVPKPTVSGARRNNGVYIAVAVGLVACFIYYANTAAPQGFLDKGPPSKEMRGIMTSHMITDMSGALKRTSSIIYNEASQLCDTPNSYCLERKWVGSGQIGDPIQYAGQAHIVFRDSAAALSYFRNKGTEYSNSPVRTLRREVRRQWTVQGNMYLLNWDQRSPLMRDTLKHPIISSMRHLLVVFRQDNIVHKLVFTGFSNMAPEAAFETIWNPIKSHLDVLKYTEEHIIQVDTLLRGPLYLNTTEGPVLRYTRFIGESWVTLQRNIKDLLFEIMSPCRGLGLAIMMTFVCCTTFFYAILHAVFRSEHDEPRPLIDLLLFIAPTFAHRWGISEVHEINRGGSSCGMKPPLGPPKATEPKRKKKKKDKGLRVATVSKVDNGPVRKSTGVLMDFSAKCDTPIDSISLPLSALASQEQSVLSQLPETSAQDRDNDLGWITVRKDNKGGNGPSSHTIRSEMAADAPVLERTVIDGLDEMAAVVTIMGRTEIANEEDDLSTGTCSQAKAKWRPEPLDVGLCLPTHVTKPPLSAHYRRWPPQRHRTKSFDSLWTQWCDDSRGAWTCPSTPAAPQTGFIGEHGSYVGSMVRIGFPVSPASMPPTISLGDAMHLMMSTPKVNIVGCVPSSQSEIRQMDVEDPPERCHEDDDSIGVVRRRASCGDRSSVDVMSRIPVEAFTDDASVGEGAARDGGADTCPVEAPQCVHTEEAHFPPRLHRRILSCYNCGLKGHEGQDCSAPRFQQVSDFYQECIRDGSFEKYVSFVQNHG